MTKGVSRRPGRLPIGATRASGGRDGRYGRKQVKSASIDLVGVGVFAVCLTATPSPAHAYLDPGTGSYILQAAMAALKDSLRTTGLATYLRFHERADPDGKWQLIEARV